MAQANSDTNTGWTVSGYCPKCGGSGKTPFTHIWGGRCFRCEGSGSIELPITKADEERSIRTLRTIYRSWRDTKTNGAEKAREARGALCFVTPFEAQAIRTHFKAAGLELED